MSAPYVYTPVERTSRRLGLFLLILLGLILTVMLFFVKARAQEARAEVLRLEADIDRSQKAISVLTAEQAALRNPDRLRALSAERLGLTPITVADTATLEDGTEGSQP